MSRAIGRSRGNRGRRMRRVRRFGWTKNQFLPGQFAEGPGGRGRRGHACRRRPVSFPLDLKGFEIESDLVPLRRGEWACRWKYKVHHARRAMFSSQIVSVDPWFNLSKVGVVYGDFFESIFGGGGCFDAIMRYPLATSRGGTEKACSNRTASSSST
jgi:hypothetical protein